MSKLFCALAVAVCAGHVVAQPCDSNLPPNGTQPPLANINTPQNYPVPIQLQALPAGGTWINNVWAADRRPAAFLRFVNPGGEWRQNAFNLFDWWHIPIPIGGPAGGIPWTDKRQDAFAYVPGTGMVYDPDGNGEADQIERMIFELDKIYAQGFRRIVLSKPAGDAWGRSEQRRLIPNDPNSEVTAYNGHDVTLNQWWGMQAWKRAELFDPARAFQVWRQTRTDVTLELYGGFPLADDFSNPSVNVPAFNGTTQPVALAAYLDNGPNDPPFLEDQPRWFYPNPYTLPARSFDPRLTNHVVNMYLSIDPWIQTGVRTVWYDAASDNTSPNFYRYGFMEWTYNPYFRSLGVRFGGEALPIVGGNPNLIDACALTKAPWMALQNYFFQTNSNVGDWKSGLTFAANRQNTEVMMLISDTLSWTRFKEARERGVILTLVNPEQTQELERLKRWYSMGPIRVADFNGDGVVSLDDQTAAWAVYSAGMANQPSIHAYVTGDFDQDGEVTTDDWPIFIDRWECEVNGIGCTGLDLVRDFGPPNDL